MISSLYDGTPTKICKLIKKEAMILKYMLSCTKLSIMWIPILDSAPFKDRLD